MLVRMGMLQQRPTSKFRKRWREGLGPVAKKLTGSRRYHQNHVVDRAQRGVSRSCSQPR